MAYNNRTQNGWNSNQHDASFMGTGPNHQYNTQQHHNGQYAPNFQPPSQNHEMAWMQQANNRSMNYMQSNGPQQQQHAHNSQFNQNNRHNHQNHNRQIKQEPRPPPKRATKRRFRHDLPGPAGAWFQLHKQKNKRRQVAEKTNEEGAKPKTAEEVASSNSKKKDNEPEQKNVPLFKDYSSQLHDCNAWNLMCWTHERIVPTFNSFSNSMDDDKETAASRYKSLLRNIVPRHQGLIHEIHVGKYDVHHLSPSIHTNDLCIPLLFGYVSSISCHAHSDWTAVLVDESYSCGGGRGITCWLEEKLVKRHPAWIRPGVVWMLEAAKLALFASKEECDDQVQDVDGGTNDISPSTEAARGGKAIDRMICVGESSLVYAWTPEEASEFFTNENFNELLEKRCKVDCEGGVEVTEQSGVNEDASVERAGVIDVTSHSAANPTQETGGPKEKISPVVSHNDTHTLEIDNFSQVEKEDKKEDRTENEGIATAHPDKVSSAAAANKQTTPQSEQQDDHAKYAGGSANHQISATEAPADRAATLPSEQQISKQTKEQTVPKGSSPVTGQIEVATNNITRQNGASIIVSVSLQEPVSSNKKSTTKPSATRANPYLKQSTGKTTHLCNISKPVLNGKSASNPHQKRNESFTPKKTKATELIEPNQKQCLPSSDSFDDSLCIDDDQWFCTNDNVTRTERKENSDISKPPEKTTVQQELTSAAAPPTLPPLASAVNTSVNTAQSTLKHKGTAAAPAATTTPKRFSNSNTSHMPMNCPPTGASFDDSLDIDDDELFCSNNNSKVTGVGQPPIALNVPKQNTDISPLGVRPEGQMTDFQQTYHTKHASNNDTAANTPVLPTRSYAFDNIDEEDLESLGEEDDL